MDTQKSTLRFTEGTYYIEDRAVFICGAEYQYYRDLQDNWADRISQIRQAGANAVTCYIPWRHHAVNTPDSSPQFDFHGTTNPARNVVRFLNLIFDAGMWAIVKPGPFVHSELNIGGLPDFVSPDNRNDIEPMKRWNGEPVTWEYDNSVLPGPFDTNFEPLAEMWLNAVGEILRPRTYPSGPVIGVQVNDETIYCLSNAPPWTAGYERSSRDMYKGAGADTELPAILPKIPISGHMNLQDTVPLRAWGRYQAWIRSETYRRYRNALNVDVPHFSNHAGVTPPIEENVPERDARTFHGSNERFLPLLKRYAEWWFAHNLIEADREIYQYGFVSWLGVTPYNIADPSTVNANHPVIPNIVFSRYINTVTRQRALNLEENWGFATLYHPYSRAPFVPVFQSLVSIAGGATGYVVFCAVSHTHWDDSLDRITKLQSNTFPSDAPIGPTGDTTPMYTAMLRLNQWLSFNGSDLVKATRHHDICFAVYGPYSAVSSWVDQWPEGEPAPFQGTDGLEELSNVLQEHGYIPAWTGLDGIDVLDANRFPVIVVRLWYWMDRTTQGILSRYVENGGTLLYLGVIPTKDWDGKSCTVLQNTAQRFADRVLALPPGEEGLLSFLQRHHIVPRTTVTPGSRAFVFDVNPHPQDRDRDRDRDRIIFFFGYDGSREHAIRIDEIGIKIPYGAKICGALRIRKDKVSSAYIKGINEVEDTVGSIRVETGTQRYDYGGDYVKT